MVPNSNDSLTHAQKRQPGIFNARKNVNAKPLQQLQTAFTLLFHQTSLWTDRVLRCDREENRPAPLLSRLERLHLQYTWVEAAFQLSSPDTTPWQTCSWQTTVVAAIVYHYANNLLLVRLIKLIFGPCNDGCCFFLAWLYMFGTYIKNIKRISLTNSRYSRWPPRWPPAPIGITFEPVNLELQVFWLNSLWAIHFWSSFFNLRSTKRQRLCLM